MGYSIPAQICYQTKDPFPTLAWLAILSVGCAAIILAFLPSSNLAARSVADIGKDGRELQESFSSKERLGFLQRDGQKSWPTGCVKMSQEQGDHATYGASFLPFLCRVTHQVTLQVWLTFKAKISF